MKKISMFLFSLLVVIGSTLLPVSAHSMVVENEGGAAYKKIRIPQEIYGEAKADLSDLLVRDEKGENVPYFLSRGIEKSNVVAKEYELVLNDTKYKEPVVQYDFSILDTLGEEEEITVTSILFPRSTTDFVKIVDLYGSYDGLRWEIITTEKLFQVEAASHLEIIFPKEEHYPQYRLSMEKTGTEPYFSSALLSYESHRIEQTLLSETVQITFHVEEQEKQSTLVLENVKHLPLESVRILTEDMFHRTIHTPVGPQVIYHLPFENQTYTDLTIPLEYTSNTDTLRLVIDNYDDKPVQIQGVELTYRASDLVFRDTQASSYTIYFGEEGSHEPLVYDIQQYQSEILQEPIDELTVSSIVWQEQEEQLEQPKNNQFLFNTIVIAVAVLLATVVLANLKNLKSPEK